MIENSALSKINSIRANLFKQGFFCSDVVKKQYNFEITVTKNKEKIKVLVYFGKKGVKTVIQGNTLSKVYFEANNIINGNSELQFKDEVDKIFDEYIGTDETGKGDFFGPLVIAGFYVNNDIQTELAKLNVRDSKELSDPQINEIAKYLVSEFPTNFTVVTIAPEEYNTLYKKFNNLNKLLSWAHSKVIADLLQKHTTKVVIIDQFSKKPINISTELEYSDIDFIQIPKAEKYIGVAAASIIARYFMNMWFEEKENEGIYLLKGASQEVENCAKKLVQNSGMEILSKLSKQHFKTTRKIFEN